MQGKWKYTVDISSWWKGKPVENGTEEWGNHNVHELGNYVANKLKNQFVDQTDSNSVNFDPDLDDVVYYLGNVDKYDVWIAAVNCHPHGSCMRRMEEDYPPLEQFNSAMSCLYDWADRNRVWVKTIF
ncbi:hypothetical protein [Escherichia coli]|uniref:hypothetical protein n=1 Tax=Escherichia coli TaxID=562 RepID=UPI000CFADCD8|nr:hypothetical protein [Escherichia coli]